MRGDEIKARPFVGVTLSYRNKTQTASCLVDSGAADILIDIEFAKELGIDIDAQEYREVGGLTGSTRGFDIELPILVEKLEDKPLTAIVTFAENMPTTGLLGHAFFDAFYVEFKQRRNFFTLAHAPVLE